MSVLNHRTYQITHSSSKILYTLLLFLSIYFQLYWGILSFLNYIFTIGIYFLFDRGILSRKQGVILVLTCLVLSVIFDRPFLELSFFLGSKYYALSVVGAMLSPVTKGKFSFLQKVAYISFPFTLIAGPIQDLSHIKVKTGYQFDYYRFLLFISSGAIRVFVIANNLDLFYDFLIYNSFDQNYLMAYLIILCLYALYYSSLSGVTEIIRGVSLLFSSNQPKTFIRPYLATSPTDMWTRWNVSIPKWVTDYIFYPTVIKTRNAVVALGISFLLISLWHEISLKYLEWGIYWFLLSLIWKYLTPLPKTIKVILLFHFGMLGGYFIETFNSRTELIYHASITELPFLRSFIFVAILFLDDYFIYKFEDGGDRYSAQAKFGIALTYTLCAYTLLYFFGVIRSPLILYSL